MSRALRLLLHLLVLRLCTKIISMHKNFNVSSSTGTFPCEISGHFLLLSTLHRKINYYILIESKSPAIHIKYTILHFLLRYHGRCFFPHPQIHLLIIASGPPSSHPFPPSLHSSWATAWAATAVADHHPASSCHSVVHPMATCDVVTVPNWAAESD